MVSFPGLYTNNNANTTVKSPPILRKVPQNGTIRHFVRGFFTLHKQLSRMMVLSSQLLIKTLNENEILLYIIYLLVNGKNKRICCFRKFAAMTRFLNTLRFPWGNA
jgi:hypothetical protein